MATKKASPENQMAIVSIGAHQYKVKTGETIKVEKINLKPSEKITISDVLLFAQDEKVKVGTPFVANTSVSFEHVATSLDDKIRVAHFRNKSRYRKVKGHRQLQTQLKVLEINHK